MCESQPLVAEHGAKLFLLMEEGLGKKGNFNARLKRAFQSLPVLGIILFIFITTFPPFEVATEVNLVVHMAQHVVIAISGVLIGYPLYRSGKFSRIKSMHTGLLGLGVISGLLVFWHLPTFWDAAVLNPLIHVIEHFCFLFIGLLIGGFLPMLPDNFKMLTLMLGLSAHMFYGFALYLITTPVYPLYPVSQQALLGVSLFAPSPIYFVGFLYITLTRETRRLDPIRLDQSAHTRKSSLNRAMKGLIPAFSIIMIIALGGYLAMTVVAISSAPSQDSANIPVIYIEETPVTWQYSPQNITVLIGSNNTVEWISHSLTYDTVTSTTGNFSHVFSPGGTFMFTFAKPGVYDYYCQYHPWMHGTIIVLP